METVDVIIASYGDTSVWAPLSQRAAQSVFAQSTKAKRVLTVHDESLFIARNSAAKVSTADWLIFLDADDELDPYYIEAMLCGYGDIRQPSTLGVHEDGHEDEYPVLIPPKESFIIGNHLVIGSMMRREMFLEVGGFRDLPCIEDWDLFIRMQLYADAEVGESPGAIYRVHVRPSSRNQDLSQHGRTYHQIQQLYQGEWFAKYGRTR